MKNFVRIIFLILAFTGNVLAGEVLFINYNGSDMGIPVALSRDSHNVTAVDVPPATANAFFQETDLAGYCAVVWSTAYAYDEDLTGASAVLSSWTGSGGHVLITAPDGIRNDGTLVGLLGGSGATDHGRNFSTVANIANSLTTGLFDIRGQQPPYIGDIDALCSPLGPDTVGLVTAESTRCSDNHEEPGYIWSLRNLGSGQVAFITSGNFSASNSDEPDWSDSTIPGDGVYSAGLRNFVYGACSSAPEAIPSGSPLSTILLILVLMVTALAGVRQLAVRR